MGPGKLVDLGSAASAGRDALSQGVGPPFAGDGEGDTGRVGDQEPVDGGAVVLGTGNCSRAAGAPVRWARDRSD